MPATQYNLPDNITLDSRGALWLPKFGVLAIADLHLGYAWAQRQRGFLFPISAPDDTLPRLQALQKVYQPRAIVLLGDIVHRAVPVPALENALKELVAELGSRSELILVRGNHDKDLEILVQRCGLPIRSLTQFSTDNHLFLHGDLETPSEAQGHLVAIRQHSGKIIMGHEHPAITLSAGPASFVKCPCFLISEELIILPAFSRFAAGTEIGKYPFMSPLAQSARFTQAVAIIGDRLAPIKELF